MTSLIDATNPVEGSPTTQSVRSNFSIAHAEITALQDTSVSDAPADAFPYQRYGAAWTRLAALFPAMFGALADGSDATAALQAGLNAACNLGLDFVVAGGTYSITGLKVYSGQRVTFAYGGALAMTAAGAAIASLPAPGATAGRCNGITLDKPAIDMCGHAGTAILLEAARFARISQPTITGIAPAGTFAWSDPYNNAGVLPNAGIILKGFPAGGDGGAANIGGGCYYNTIEIVSLMMGDPGTAGYGIWLGTSAGALTQRANFNQVYGGQISGFAAAVYLSAGGDNTFESLDVSENTTGYVLGADAPSVNRTRIVKPYCELCQVGVRIGVNADHTMFEGAGSWAGTVVPIQEDAGNGGAPSLYQNLITPAGAAQLFDPSFLGGGSNLWFSAAGAGGSSASFGGIAAVGYSLASNLVLALFGGAAAAKLPVTANTVIGRIIGAGWDGTQLSADTDTNAGVDIALQTAENWSPTAHGSRVLIHVTAPGTIGPRITEVSISTAGTRFFHGIGAWNATPPAAQPTATGGTHTVIAGSGNQVFTNTTFDGNTGSTGYTVGDLVRILKSYGLIAN